VHWTKHVHIARLLNGHACRGLLAALHVTSAAESRVNFGFYFY
jgi:hypothetical protein